MRKLRLHLDQLEVETFEVSEGGERKGTVNGAERTIYCNTDEVANCSNYTCDPPSCPAESCGDCGTYYCGSGADCNDTQIDTCYLSCWANSCLWTCPGFPC